MPNYSVHSSKTRDQDLAIKAWLQIDSGGANYSEIWGLLFDRANKSSAETSGLLSLVANACSMMFSLDDHHQPFAPIMVMQNCRCACLDDFDGSAVTIQYRLRC
jgi:hypothetical protein